MYPWLRRSENENNRWIEWRDLLSQIIWRNYLGATSWFTIANTTQPTLVGRIQKITSYTQTDTSLHLQQNLK